MRVLIIGYSNIVVKRVLPALQNLGSIQQIDIASRRPLSANCLGNKSGKIFNGYAHAFDESTADLAYISVINSEHESLVEKALQRGLHVVVDKPACTSLAAAERLMDLAASKNLCLAEAVVYPFHPQIDRFLEMIRFDNSEPTRAIVGFSFPPLNPSDFRYSQKMGGGALWDLGPYAVSAGRLIFNSEPVEIVGRILSRAGDENLDTSFSILMTYPGGRSLVGHFGFNTQYRNFVDVFGPKASVSMERFYTSTPTLENSIQFQSGSENKIIKTPAADSFELFLKYIVSSIAKKDFGKLGSWLLQDARLLHQLRQSCEEKLYGNTCLELS